MRSLFITALVALAALVAADSSQAWQMKQAPLMTRWADQVDRNAPLPEYPRPQMVRADWLNLNGLWQFQPANPNDPLPAGQTLSDEILVPFPMESAISGVMAHHPRAWYRRSFTVPQAWNGNRILLHLDAVDWESEVFINGTSVGLHQGGYDPITYDITPHLTALGPQELIVRVHDPSDHAGIARGKQTLHPGGIMFTTCTGIWQPVWLEPVPATGIHDLKLVPDVDHERLRLTVHTLSSEDVSVAVTVSSNGTPVTTFKGSPNTELSIPIPHPRLWGPGHPFLYDLSIATLQNGATQDTVTSYFGMRKISVGVVDGIQKMLLNDEFLFQMGPLDQGFWPDGIYTAPTDEALRYDIEQTLNLGFNMTRKHIKVERARWYYWADKLGLLVWQDMPSVNSYTRSPQPIDEPQFRHELNQMVENLHNSPSIILWVIFNEGQGQHNTEALVREIALRDPSRLINQASGGAYFGVGDILDEHHYPDPTCPTNSPQVRVCGEYGGVGCEIPGHLWNPELALWNKPEAKDPVGLATLYDGFVSQLLAFKSHQGLSAAVYTEITDVETERCGLMTYDRVMKPSVDRIRASNRRVIHGQRINAREPEPVHP